MPWVILAILAALLWTVVNIMDKFIISHEVRDPIMATVISGISTFILFGVVSLLFGDIFLSLATIIIAIIAGALFNVAVLLYYSAMSKEEVTRFIPLLSTIPIFVSVFAFLFLGEKFTALTYFGIILIVAGAILISIKKITYKISLHSAFFLIAISSAVLYALRNIALKFATLQASIWSIFFWVGVGGGLVSVFLFAFHHPHILKKAKSGVRNLLFVGALTAVVLFIFTVAISIGPVSLVSALLETQPFFVFVAATILSIYYPKIMKEKITKPVLLQKLAATTMAVIGAILIAQNYLP